MGLSLSDLLYGVIMVLVLALVLGVVVWPRSHR
jgi:hypothetical protein